ncbi:MAG: alpha-galactosidase [Chthoniobacteraceae bacterium]
MITFKDSTFHLRSQATSYVLAVAASGELVHAYWGAALREPEVLHRLNPHDVAFSPRLLQDRDGLIFSLDTAPREYPDYGRGDYRAPAFQVQAADGSTLSTFRYVSHSIRPGKPALEGLPATYVEADAEADTLEILLRDALTGVEATLSYTVFNELDAITRSARFSNTGSQPVRLLRALSASVDLPEAGFELLQLSGAWARERHVARTPLRPGTQSLESRRGASSHQQNPFIALLDPSTTEDTGRVYGLNLVYSGNFLAQAEVDQLDTTRVSIGINPFDFSWLLEPGESFQTPEAVLVFSSEGLNGLSQRYHRLYRTRLCRGPWRDKVRPILINNWEATYFEFNAEKIEAIASTAGDLGIELFVLDDGWFGHRDDDCTSLGDWTTDLKKLPAGLPDLVERINARGLRFGLWFEPEMISPDSDLYRAHPDWCLHVGGRDRTEGRQQLVLDFSRPEVCDAIIEKISAVLASAPITYVKWDMNRHMSEIGSASLPPARQRETAHRYMLGLYRVMGEITGRFPEVLFESCSGGGGRFDPGILFYMPQTWTSDDSDAVERLKIQYGTSLVYPVSAQGAHVSACPNHQVGRVTSLAMRGHVAMSGNFGYELDLNQLTPQERETVRAQVALYKDLRGIIQTGTFYRLRSPFEGGDAAWMTVSEDGSRAVVFYFQVLAKPNPGTTILRLKGLDPTRRYRVSELGRSLGGDVLMNAGLRVDFPHPGDFQSVIWQLERE